MSPAARDYPPGERIPGTVYQVVRRLGAGGMGTVYDVEDTTIGKRYVLKALHPQLGDREDLARRMQNEARVLARLHHPNIVEVITAGVTSDELRLPYYVMERLTGQSLRIVLEKKGRLDLPHALHIAIDLLDALEHAHEKGVIHRDVKPDNIFLHSTNAGITVTKLLDFGIVSLLSAGKRETAGRFLGTLRYAAPEQLRGEDPSPRMDIYCAGLVLYELIAGRGPFDEQGDSTQIADAHLHRTAPPVSRFAPVPPALDAMIAAALAKLPDGRPRDAFSFAASLRNLKRALSPSSERPGDSTGSRATAVVVGAPSGAAPFVDLRLSAPGGSYVVSPAPVPPPPASAESLPRTTVRGMVVPTLGPELAPITANAAEPVDRQAATHSLVVAQPIAGQAGTEVLAPAVAPGGTMRLHPLPMVDEVAPIRWPPEQPLAPSEGPQVRTLAAGSAPKTSRAALVMTLSAMLGLAAVAVVLLLVRREGAHRAPPVVPPPVTVAATAPPPDPAPVVAIPAPTLAPPALEDPTPVASGTPSASVIPSAAASQSARPPAKPRSAVAAKPAGLPPAVAPNLGDRPGPGF
jgi:serine/threonine-protein kinase